LNTYIYLNLIKMKTSILLSVLHLVRFSNIDIVYMRLALSVKLTVVYWF